MNYINPGAIKRHATAPRKSPVGNEPMARQIAAAATLSTLELRQLVAAMVD